ncbi:cupin domain-containing protein [Streptomyces sp. RPA4-5]|uniref:cupin domain-containing protein n=1 Tax=Streptomyces sp. RPA4-5 TaxID=2721245 RepID=UPI00143E74AF|nr:cupin domain-containing protein [Streptomyces sp. RPA4-5]QIY55312.1 cupin domain-containing protein [Streptomyces sp. RPA4-5]
MPKERFLVLQPGERRPGRVPLPPGCDVKARTADTEGRLAILENQLDVDIPPHTHHHADEFVYVLDGAMEVDVDGTTHRLTPGMCALLPHGIPHALRNASQPPARCLQISAPGGWEEFVEDLCEAGPAIRKGGQPDLDRLNEIGAKYGMEYHG